MLFIDCEQFHNLLIKASQYQIERKNSRFKKKN